MLKQMNILGLALALLLMPIWEGTRVQPAVAAMDYAYHGNRNSRVYHNSSCRYFWCKACTVGFQTAREAAAQGFRPCKVCGG